MDAGADPAESSGSQTDLNSGGADNASGSSDPGMRLLSRVGAFVEPLTRHDRGHLTLQASEHVEISIDARQTFHVIFGTSKQSGNGGLPSGVIAVENVSALARESEAQRATAQAAAPARLAAWAQQHGENPAARPAVADVFTAVPPLGCVEPCGVCSGKGEVTCGGCNGARRVTCTTCGGSGRRSCGQCSGQGQQTCRSCAGMGYRLHDRQDSYHDAVTNTTQYRTVQDRVTCACSGGRVTCSGCGGGGTNACMGCSGDGQINCSRCNARGAETCGACTGTGRHFQVIQLSCAIGEALVISPRTSEPDVLNVLGKLTTMEALLGYSLTSRAIAETNADTLHRDTIATTPVTTINIAVGEKVARIRGFGPAQDVHDFGNIAGLLLTGDLERLEAALPATRAFPPRTTPEMEGALSSVLASEVNVAIAQHAAKKDKSALTREFRGVVSDAFVERAALAIRQGIGRVYWSSMLRGPAALLAIPLIQFLVQFLVRGQDPNSQTTAMFGLMLLAFGGAIGAHLWCVRLVQRRIRPNGVPKMIGVINRLGLTTQWLVGAAVWCVVTTYLVALLASLILPCTFRVMSGIGPALCMLP